MSKIIFYIDTMQRAGAQRVFANLFNYFKKLGFEIVLVNDIRLISTIQEYDIDNDIRRFFLEDYIKHFNNRIIGNFERLTAIRKICKKQNPDYIISFLGAPNWRMLLSTIGINARKIISVRNDPYFECGKGFRRIIFNIIFLLADGIVFQTEEASKYFIKSIRKKSCVIFNPVDNKFYIDGSHSEKSILFVGRLEEQKNPMLLLDAFSNLAKKYTQYNLIFIGEGSLKKQLQESTVRLGLSDRVKFVGNVNNVEDYLRIAKIFVLTSNFEGMPNALMEAMASGLTVISTDCPCGGPRSLIQSDDQGLLFECNNQKDLESKLDNVLSNEEIMNIMGMKAKLRAEEFKPSLILNQWKEFVLNKRSI